MGFRLFSQDITQVYFQSKSNLTRKVFTRPKPQDIDLLGLKKGETFELVRALYGLCDDGGYQGETMTTHMINELYMRQTHRDATLYYPHEEEGLVIIAGMYVDELLNAGTQSF